MSHAWKRATLHDLVELQRGYDLPSQDRLPGNIPVMGGGGLNGFHAVANVKGPGVVIGRSGAGFGTAFYSEDDFWAHNTVLFVKNFNGNDTNYVYHFLKWFDFSTYNSGGAQPSLNRNFIYPIEIEIPPLPEQTAIASVLSTWDLSIEKTERLIAAKERHYLWLSKKHLFGNATDTAKTSNKTKWFSVPDHWKIVNIGKIANEVRSFNNSGESIPVLSCTKYDGLVDSLTYFDKQVFSHDTSTYKVVAKGEFAYATNHIEEGSIGYQSIHDRGLVSPMYTVFETNEKVDDSYLYKVLKSLVYLHIFRANTSSSVDRRGSLRWKEFAKLPIPLPPIEEQKQIAAILTTARQEIDLLKKQADAYRRQKCGLMQRLLTGQWRVPSMKENS